MDLKTNYFIYVYLDTCFVVCVVVIYLTCCCWCLLKICKNCYKWKWQPQLAQLIKPTQLIMLVNKCWYWTFGGSGLGKSFHTCLFQMGIFPWENQVLSWGKASFSKFTLPSLNSALCQENLWRCLLHEIVFLCHSFCNDHACVCLYNWVSTQLLSFWGLV